MEHFDLISPVISSEPSIILTMGLLNDENECIL